MHVGIDRATEIEVGWIKSIAYHDDVKLHNSSTSHTVKTKRKTRNQQRDRRA